MAIYSHELMHRAGNQFTYDHVGGKTYLASAFCASEAAGITPKKPMAYRDVYAGTKGVPLNEITADNTTLSPQLPSTIRPFSPFGDTSYMTSPTSILKRDRNGDLVIDLMGWFKSSVLSNMVKDNYAISDGVWELFVYQEYTRYWSRTYATFPIVRLDIAQRSAQEADIPENWFGSKNPDLRFVVDTSSTTYKLECTDLIFNATKTFCESKRYAVDGEQYRQSFIQKPYSA